jgi:Beta protein
MINKFYMPILKTKQGEFLALSLLNPSIQGYLVPLIEVTNIEFDNEENTSPKTIEEHLIIITGRIAKKWGRSNAFLDTHLVNGTTPGDINPVKYIYNRFVGGITFPSPVLRLSTPENIKNAIREVMSEHNLNEAAIRVFVPDIMVPEFSKNIRQLLDYFELDTSAVHIVLDLAAADFSHTEDFTDSILDQLRDFPEFPNWKSFTVCGGSFPKTNLLKVGESIVPRGEWMFYKELVSKLKKQQFNRHINYGDYGIIAPGHFKFDFKKMDRSANIRYTHDDIWFVVKGNSIKLNGNEQYKDLAKDVIKSDYFLGENFSDGDSHLKKSTIKNGKAGNTTVWKRVGFNHHFTKVMADLRASYLAF